MILEGYNNLSDITVKMGYPICTKFCEEPFILNFELRPKSASIVYNINKNINGMAGSGWRCVREKNWLESLVSIYEIHLGLWMRVSEESNRWST